MKHLISLLIAAVYSVFAGIGFTLPKEDDFVQNAESPAYYSPAEGSEDYRSLYSSNRGFNTQGAEPCNTTPRLDDRVNWKKLSAVIMDWGEAESLKTVLGDFWSPVADGAWSSLTTSSGGVTFVLGQETNVCAPKAGTIQTSHFSCDYGHRMDFSIQTVQGNFTMTITGAKCWYCCADKEEPEDGRYTAVTSDSLRDKELAEGYVLCVGKEGTIVTIMKES